MWDRARYDSAMFWLAFGTAASVIGLALMTIGVSRSAAGANLLVSPWFDAGLVLLLVGGLLLLWALGLYLVRRRIKAEAQATGALQVGTGNQESPKPRAAGKNKSDWMSEAVRGYYAERNKMMETWEKRGKQRRPKK